MIYGPNLAPYKHTLPFTPKSKGRLASTQYLHIGAISRHELLVDVWSSFSHVAFWGVDTAATSNLKQKYSDKHRPYENRNLKWCFIEVAWVNNTLAEKKAQLTSTAFCGASIPTSMEKSGGMHINTHYCWFKNKIQIFLYQIWFPTLIELFSLLICFVPKKNLYKWQIFFKLAFISTISSVSWPEIKVEINSSCKTRR